MEMYQDGVRVWNCIGYCSADVEKGNPATNMEECPTGQIYCDPGCVYYEED